LTVEARTRDAGSDAFEIQLGGNDPSPDNDRGQGSDDVFYFG
jgi:hypothetical protein